MCHKIYEIELIDVFRQNVIEKDMPIITENW